MKFLNQSKYKSGKETWKQYDLFALIISHIRLRVGGISVLKIKTKFWREKCLFLTFFQSYAFVMSEKIYKSTFFQVTILV